MPTSKFSSFATAAGKPCSWLPFSDRFGSALSPDWVSEAYAGLTQVWITSPDLATFEEANGGLAYIYWDEVITARAIQG